MIFVSPEMAYATFY